MSKMLVDVHLHHELLDVLAINSAVDPVAAKRCTIQAIDRAEEIK